MMDIVSLHPKGIICDTDRDYSKIANKILQKFNTIHNMDLSQTEIKEFALRLTLYFEDVVSDLGIWRSFTDWNNDHYGKYIPFYNYDKKTYSQDKPQIEDVKLVLWLCMSETHDGIIYPYNKFITTLSKMAFDVMDKEFEDMPINEELKSYFEKAEFVNDFIAQRDVLKWLYFLCYLNNTKRCKNIYLDSANDFDGMFEEKGPYCAECDVTYSQKIGPLAIHAQQWLSMILRANQNYRAAKIIEEQDFRRITVYKIEDINGNNLIFRSPADEMINITLDALNHPKISELKKGFAICSLVKYDDVWQLNGVFAAIPEHGAFDQFMNEEKRKKMERTPNYNHLMVLSGNSPIFYMKNQKEFIEFAINEMNIPKNMARKPFNTVKNKIDASSDITLYIENEIGMQSLAIGVARSIKDVRNPLYDSNYAKKNAILDLFEMPDDMCRYVISHHLVPDASFLTYDDDNIDGNKLMQDNLDFLARVLRGNDY